MQDSAVNSAEQLLDQLHCQGGAILSADCLSSEDVRRAKADNRYCEIQGGIGFVRMSNSLLTLKDLGLREFIEAKRFEAKLEVIHKRASK